MAKKGTTKYHSNKQEKEVAKELGGRVQIASGSLWHCPADVRTDRFLTECKTTEKPRFSITTKIWEKIRKEAINDGLRSPLMCVRIKETSFAVFESKEFLGQANIASVIPFHLATQYDLKGHNGSKSFSIRYNDLYGDAFLVGGIHLLYLRWDYFLELLEKVERNEARK